MLSGLARSLGHLGATAAVQQLTRAAGCASVGLVNSVYRSSTQCSTAPGLQAASSYNHAGSILAPAGHGRSYSSSGNNSGFGRDFNPGSPFSLMRLEAIRMKEARKLADIAAAARDTRSRAGRGKPVPRSVRQDRSAVGGQQRYLIVCTGYTSRIAACYGGKYAAALLQKYGPEGHSQRKGFAKAATFVAIKDELWGAEYSNPTWQTFGDVTAAEANKIRSFLDSPEGTDGVLVFRVSRWPKESEIVGLLQELYDLGYCHIHEDPFDWIVTHSSNGQFGVVTVDSETGCFACFDCLGRPDCYHAECKPPSSWDGYMTCVDHGEEPPSADWPMYNVRKCQPKEEMMQ